MCFSSTTPYHSELNLSVCIYSMIFAQAQSKMQYYITFNLSCRCSDVPSDRPAKSQDRNLSFLSSASPPNIRPRDVLLPSPRRSDMRRDCTYMRPSYSLTHHRTRPAGSNAAKSTLPAYHFSFISLPIRTQDLTFSLSRHQASAEDLVSISSSHCGSLWSFPALGNRPSCPWISHVRGKTGSLYPRTERTP